MNIVYSGSDMVVTGTGGGMKVSNCGGFEITMNKTSVGEIGKIVDAFRGTDCASSGDYTWGSFTGVGSSSGGTRTFWDDNIWSSGDFLVYGIDGGYYMNGKGLIKESEFNAVEIVDEMAELRGALEERWQEYFDECVWKPDLSGFYEHLSVFGVVGDIVRELSSGCEVVLKDCKINVMGGLTGAYIVEMKFNKVGKVGVFEGKRVVSGFVTPSSYNYIVGSDIIRVNFSFHMYDMLTDTEKELYVRHEKILGVRDKWFKKGVEKIGELVEWWRKEKVLRENGCNEFRGPTVSLGAKVSKELYGDVVMEMNEEIDGIRENS